MANSSILKCGTMVRSEGRDMDNDRKDEIQSEQALVEAAASGDCDTVNDLLNSGVSVDAEEYNKLLFYASKNYVTPLQIAAANGHDKCVQVLIDHEADVNAKDRFDVTALHMASEKGNYMCVKALLDAGADCCVRTKFSKSGCYTAVPHLGGTNPLHLAAANNHVDCVKELIQYGADYNAVDERGRTSLYIAAQAGFDECVLAHLKNAVGRDILSLPSFETSDTPLHFAVNRGMVDCVRELLYLGSDVNHINFLGCSPLHIALTPSNEKACNRMEILKLLVLEGYNTDINRPDAGGFTPLHYVCFNGYRNLWCRRPDMAKFLISYGADVNIKNNQGCSLLELELKSSEINYDILKYLVKSMLFLPRLKSLNVSPRRNPAPPPAPNPPVDIRYQNQNVLEHAVLYRAFIADQIVPDFYFPQNNEVMDIFPDNVGMVPLALPNRLGVVPPLRTNRVRFAPRQPLLMQVYDAIEGMIDERHLAENENEAEQNLQFDSPYILKKQLWYEKMASNPRTLQHHCRYVVRNFMGPMKLKHIRKLPIPTILQSYLLLELDE